MEIRVRNLYAKRKIDIKKSQSKQYHKIINIFVANSKPEF